MNYSKMKKAELIEELKKLQKQVEKTLGAQEIEYLAMTALDFAVFPPEEDFYAYVGRQLKEIIGNSVILVFSYDESSKLLECRSLVGLGKLTGKVLKLMGKSPIGMRFALLEDLEAQLKKGKFFKLSKGMYELVQGKISETACTAIEKLLGLKGIYALGIAREGQLYAHASILARKGAQLADATAIEAFANQASIALQRRLAQEALKESKEKYRDILENTSDLVQIVAPDGKILFANRGWRETLGYSEEETPGMSLFDIIHPDSMEHCMETFKRVMSGETVRDIKATFVAKDGRQIVIEGNASCKLMEGNPVAAMCIFHDVTERKLAEETLRGREKWLRALVANVPGAVYRAACDPENWTIAFFSDPIEEITGYPASDFIGDEVRTYASIIHPDDTKMVEEIVLDCVDKKLPFALEYRITCADGSIRWVHDRGRGVFDDDGELLWLDGVVLDITERKLAEKKLAHLNAVLRAIRNVNQLITKEHDQDKLINGACGGLTETRGYHNAWIALVDESGKVEKATGAGPDEYMQPKLEHMKSGEMPPCATTALKQTRVVVTEDTQSGCTDCPLAKYYHGRGALTVRLEHGGKVYGLLSASIPSAFAADKEEQSLFEEVADDISYALHSIELDKKRKGAEKETAMQQKIMIAINAVFEKAITCEKEEDLAKTCLEVAQELVGAKFGFFGEVSPEGKFDTLAISNPGWDECKMPHSEATKIIKGMEIRGMQFLPLIDGKSRFFNDPSDHPESVGTPEGHPEITCLLAVPLKHRGKVIGEIGLGNKEEGYDLEDQKAIEALSVAIVETLMRKRAEQALRESEVQFRGVFESKMIGTLFWNADGDITDANDVFLKMVGYTRDEILSGEVRWRDMTPPEFKEQDDKMLAEIAAKGVGTPIEKEYIRKDGSRVPILLGAASLPGPELNDVAFVLDITERKRAEEALRKSEERYRLHFENVLDVVFSYDVNFTVLSASPSVEKAIGYKPEELVGKSFPQLNILTPESLRNAVANAKRLLNGEKIPPTEYVFITKDGKEKYLEVTSSPLSKEGKVIAALSVARDVTERKKVIEATRRLEAQKMVVEKMKELDRMKSEFVSTVTHELRTPMTPLKSTIEMLLDGSLGELTDRQEKFITMMARNVERLAQFTTEVLTLSRLESGSFKLAPTVLALRETLEPVMELMQQKARSKNSTVSFDIDPEISAYADANSLSIVGTNLTNNAIVHTGEGAQISVSARKLDKDLVEVSVTDNGQGIPEESLENLFDRFYQAKRKAGAGYQGTGVGLAVCKALVEAMGGKISVESRVGEGTTFKFTLPASPPQKEDEEVKE